MKKLQYATLSRFEVVAFVVGMAILTFELTAARIIAPYLGNTIYTWTSIIGVILAALAYGYTRGGKWADKRQQPSDIVLCLVTAALIITLLNFSKDPVLSWLTSQALPLQFSAFTASLLLFAPPTYLLGLTAPYLSRLSISSVATSGQHLSRIDAASTIGSLIGTFLTGYLLFGLVGSRHLLSLLAIGLVITSFVLPARRHRKWQYAALIIVGIAAIVTPKIAITGVIDEIDTAYSRIIIRDISYNGRPVRAYQTDSDGLQSGVYTDGQPGQPFAYIRGFEYASKLQPDGKKYLIIGGGAFTFPQQLADSHPTAVVDTVEIDSRLPAIATRHFGFKQPPNLHIITNDGRTYLNTNQTRYDMIFLDAFSSTVPPFQLLTAQAAAHASASLTADGIIATNVISAADQAHGAMMQAVYSTYRSQFAHVAIYRVEPGYALTDRQNLLVIASKQPIDPRRLTSVAQQNPEFAAMLAADVPQVYDSEEVLRDDFAPVEQLAL